MKTKHKQQNRAIVGFTDDGRLIGEEAASVCGRRPACFCCDAKRHLETCARGETLTVGTETLVPEQVFGMLLERLAAFAETHRRNTLGASPETGAVRDIVVALPACELASEAVQARVVDAARTVGLHVRALASDAVAAAVCYVATHPAVAAGAAPARVLIVDVGECGVNAVAVELCGGTQLRVLAQRSVHGCGGAACDARVAAHVLAQFCARTRVPEAAVTARGRAALARAVEKAKALLSTIPATQVVCEAFHEGVDLAVPLTRAELADLCAAELRGVTEAVAGVLADAGIGAHTDLAACEIIGGGLRSPLVQQAVLAALERAAQWPADRALDRSLDSASSVATGCALIGQLVAGARDLAITVTGAPGCAADAIVVPPERAAHPELYLADAAVADLQRAAAAYNAADAQRRERLEARHALERYVSDTRMLLHATGDDAALAASATEPEREQLRALFAETDDWVADHPQAATAELRERLAATQARVAEAAPRFAQLLAERAEAKRREEEAARNAPPPVVRHGTADKREPRTKKQKLELAQRRKDQGNQQFKEGVYDGACTRYAQALAALDKLTEADNVTPEEQAGVDALRVTLYVNSAIALQKHGAALTRVIDNCDKALALDPRCVKALFRRGTCLRELKDLARAEQDMRRVLELDPANAAAKRELAAIDRAKKAELQRQKRLAQSMFSALGKM